MPSTARRSESSDAGLLDLLRLRGPLGIADVANATRVTATAVRQRLNRLMGQGMVARDTFQAPRGRPSHRYSLTDKARRQAGTNFPDLTLALWQELRSIADPTVRSGLLKRLAKRMAAEYAPAIRGNTVPERMASVAALFAERNIPFAVEVGETGEQVPDRTNETFDNEPIDSESHDSRHAAASASDSQPKHSTHQNSTHQYLTLNVLACPYPELAEHDRGICAVENLMLTELLGERVKLTECRLDGSDCCRFQTAASQVIMPVEC